MAQDQYKKALQIDPNFKSALNNIRSVETAS